MPDQFGREMCPHETFPESLFSFLDLEWSTNLVSSVISEGLDKFSEMEGVQLEKLDETFYYALSEIPLWEKILCMVEEWWQFTSFWT